MKDPNPKYCLVSEGFAGTIPFQQVKKALDESLKAERRSASRKAARTCKALGFLPDDWKNPSVGLITDQKGNRFIIVVPTHTTTVEE